MNSWGDGRVSFAYAKYRAWLIQEASRSLALLSATPEYEDRKKILSKFQDTLENNLVPQLQKALSDRDPEATVKLYGVYATIQKQSRFEVCLFEAKTRVLLESWKDFNVETSTQIALSKGLDPAGVFIDWLDKFYSSLHSLVLSERDWMGGVLSNASALVFSLINYALTHLDPRLKERLDSVLRAIGPASFPVLASAYKATVQFGLRMEKSLLEDAVTTKSRTYQNDKGQDDDGEPGVWGLPLFEEFTAFQVDYGVYERNALLQVLAGVLEDSRKSTNHMV